MRIYFDENFPRDFISGLKSIQNNRQAEGIEVRSIVEDFRRGVPDEEWIPVIAKENGAVVTMDREIYRKRAQRGLCKEVGVGVFFVKQPKKNGLCYWEIVQIIIHCWRDICKKAKSTRQPFFYIIYYNTKNIRPLD